MPLIRFYISSLFIVGCFIVAQLEDDYYTAHHGGSFAVRLGLMFVALSLGWCAIFAQRIGR